MTEVAVSAPRRYTASNTALDVATLAFGGLAIAVGAIGLSDPALKEREDKGRGYKIVYGIAIALGAISALKGGYSIVRNIRANPL